MSECAGKVLSQCEVCWASDKAPRLPVAAAPTASPLNGELQVGFLFLGDTIALLAMDLYSKYTFVAQVRSENLSGMWDAFCGPYIAVVAQPNTIQMDEWG